MLKSRKLAACPETPLSGNPLRYLTRSNTKHAGSETDRVSLERCQPVASQEDRPPLLRPLQRWEDPVAKRTSSKDYNTPFSTRWLGVLFKTHHATSCRELRHHFSNSIVLVFFEHHLFLTETSEKVGNMQSVIPYLKLLQRWQKCIRTGGLNKSV